MCLIFCWNTLYYDKIAKRKISDPPVVVFSLCPQFKIIELRHQKWTENGEQPRYYMAYLGNYLGKIKINLNSSDELIYVFFYFTYFIFMDKIFIHLEWTKHNRKENNLQMFLKEKGNIKTPWYIDGAKIKNSVLDILFLWYLGWNEKQGGFIYPCMNRSLFIIVDNLL